MNPKIIKILRKANDQELLKLPEVRKETARINALLKPYQLDRTVKTARDVYTLSILEEGLKINRRLKNCTSRPAVRCWISGICLIILNAMNLSDRKFRRRSPK